MSTCEKCWRDAHWLSEGSVPDTYARLVKERNCTPEEQAGPDAMMCPDCRRMTMHQYTSEPMCGCPLQVAEYIARVHAERIIRSGEKLT